MKRDTRIDFSRHHSNGGICRVLRRLDLRVFAAIREDQ